MKEDIKNLFNSIRMLLLNRKIYSVYLYKNLFSLIKSLALPSNYNLKLQTSDFSSLLSGTILLIQLLCSRLRPSFKPHGQQPHIIANQTDKIVFLFVTLFEHFHNVVVLLFFPSLFSHPGHRQ